MDEERNRKTIDLGNTAQIATTTILPPSSYASIPLSNNNNNTNTNNDNNNNKPLPLSSPISKLPLLSWPPNEQTMSHCVFGAFSGLLSSIMGVGGLPITMRLG